MTGSETWGNGDSELIAFSAYTGGEGGLEIVHLAIGWETSNQNAVSNSF